jgi:hypothetical protein
MEREIASDEGFGEEADTGVCSYVWIGWMCC